MNHEKVFRISSLRSLAAVALLALGTLSLTGCGDDDEVAPEEEQDLPTQQQQDSPMENATTDTGLDQDGSAGAQPPMEEEPERGEAPISDEDDPMYEDMPTSPDEEEEGQ